MTLCNATNRGFVCNLPYGHSGDHTTLPFPGAVCGIMWPHDEKDGDKMSPHNSSDAILTARGATYGDYSEQAAFSQDLKDSMGQTPNWHDLKPSQRESLEMIATKISRILHGDPNHLDSYLDIAGYAHLAAGWKP